MAGSAHRLGIDGNHPDGCAGYRGRPGDKAALELLGIENGQDITEAAVIRCAIVERTEATKKAEFLDAKEDDPGEAPGEGLLRCLVHEGHGTIRIMRPVIDFQHG